MSTDPFWTTTPLAEMSEEQWESLCDGCARCCLHKLQDAHTEKVYYTDIACRLLDEKSCRCTRYGERQRLVEECVVIRPENLGELQWLPDTCAYRLLAEGKPLYPWHPLVSGDPASVHLADISVRECTVSEDAVHEDDYEDHIIRWVAAD
ncbi:MAG: YcgN family cysteine cluster protein [Pseudomonadota bacterium]